jgi:hypothetical protein
MVDVPVTIACGNYDRTRAIKDGTVRIEGCAVTYLPLFPEEIFHRAFKFREFDIPSFHFQVTSAPSRRETHPMLAFQLSFRAFFGIPESTFAREPG